MANRRSRRGNSNNKRFQDKIREKTLLLETSLTEAKGVRIDLTDLYAKSMLKIAHFDLPICNAAGVPNLKSYIDRKLVDFNKYLGYDSQLTSTQVMDALDANAEFYTAALILKRYYDSKSWTTPYGVKCKEIFGNAVVDALNGQDYAPCIKKRIATDLTKMSNAVWITDVVDQVSEVVMPPLLLQFYDYYLSNYFDVTDSGNNESKVLLTMWPEISKTGTKFSLKFVGAEVDAEFDDDHAYINTTYRINSTKFKSLTTNMLNANTTLLVKFAKEFLGWSNVGKDFTRDIYGESVTIIRDLDLINQFNHMMPEQCHDISSDYFSAAQPNSWTRYYFDFEMPYEATEEDPDIAIKYYYSLPQSEYTHYLFTDMGDLDVCKIDFKKWLLASLLHITEEATAGGGLYSVLTPIILNTGAIPNPLVNYIQQIAIGNDISFDIHASGVLPIDPNVMPIKCFKGILSDSNEVPEVTDELAIFRFAYNKREHWSFSAEITHDPEHLDDDLIDITGITVETMIYSTNIATPPNTVDDFWHSPQGILYPLDPSEVNAAEQAIVFRLFTTFWYTLSEANMYTRDMFKGKQQDIKD